MLFSMANEKKKLMSYLCKFERLIEDEKISELEYAAECFMCKLREFTATLNQESEKENLSRCAERMRITVQKKEGVLELHLPRQPLFP